ncbi:MAG TPA: hypothetical protein PKN33_10320 [Phycisphaerae bacterium]|nr:hypothetical protein [Phycisphaerae bacterium]
MRQPVIAAVSGLILICGGVGCFAPKSTGLEVAASIDAFGAPKASTPIGDIQLYDDANKTIQLTSAVNEVVGFRLRVNGAGQVNVAMSDFETPQHHRLSNNVDIFRIHNIDPGRFPGWYVKRMEPSRRPRSIPDVLVPARAPRGGLPADISGSEGMELWIDVRVPRGTSPGEYAANVNITINGKPATQVPVALTVWPFVLPDNTGSELIVDLDHQALFAHHVTYDGQPYHPTRVLEGSPMRVELSETITATMRMLREHGLSPQLPKLFPIAKIDADQSIQVDWSDYDWLVTDFLDGAAYRSRLPSRSWTIPFDETFPPPPSYGSQSSPMYSRLLKDYLASAASHFDQHGWLSRSYARIPNADATAKEFADNIAHYGYICRQADSRLRTLAIGIPQDMSEFGWHDFHQSKGKQFVDIWAPRGQFFDRNAPVGGTMFALDRPPFTGSTSVYSPAVDTRVIGWQAQSSRVEGVLLGLANHWPDAETEPASPQACIEFDPNVLLYPGSYFGLNEPIASMRLKRLRRGAQDGLYLYLLQEFRGKEHIARAVLDSLLYRFGADAYGAHFADGSSHAWCENPYAWDAARNICAQEMRTDAGADAEPIEDALRWQQFMQAVRHVRFETRGVRVKRGVGESALDIDFVVQVTNDSRVPIEGTLRIEDPPVGWTLSEPTKRIDSVPPGKKRSVVMSASAPTITWGDSGVRYLSLLFESEGKETTPIPVRMCHVAAPPLEDPIKLDGDLGDWPASVGNDAGSFVLISGLGTDAKSFASGGPTHDTTCVTGTRDGKLYIGLRCAFDPSNRRVIGESSAAAPEDLVPVGEDAVEILIDPTNAGTRSTGDLYHIVVRSGGVEWEHGVTLNPPTGPVKHWPTSIEHAARIHDDVWTAEIAIPLDAFPEGYRSASVWGFNVARFDYTSQQYSNWAGAVGNVYDPQALGNLTIP